MIVIGILGHGEFPYGLLNASDVISGSQEGVFAVGLKGEDSPESYGQRVRDEMEKYGHEAQFLLLTDLMGGTPCNVAAGFLSDNVVCLTGANLPMLLHAILSRDVSGFKELAQETLQAGGEGQVDLGAELKNVR